MTKFVDWLPQNWYYIGIIIALVVTGYTTQAINITDLEEQVSILQINKLDSDKAINVIRYNVEKEIAKNDKYFSNLDGQLLKYQYKEIKESLTEIKDILKNRR